MEKAELTILIQKLLAGKATPEEKERLEQCWNQALEEDHYMQFLTQTEQEALRKEMFGNIRHIIRERIRQQPILVHRQPVKELSTSSFTKIYWQVAAAIVLVVAVGVLVLSTFNRSNFTTQRTIFGKQKEIILPDQSVVILNGNSSIRYASAWNSEKAREVWLEGEAYFSVQHTQSHQKFIVHTSDLLQVEVLGTKFNVNNRNKATNVVLQEGKVKVSDASSTYTMQPGEMVSYSLQKPRLIPKKVNAQVLVAWKDNILLFKDESLHAIFSRLRESHGIKVIFKNAAIAEEVFNGSVPGDSVELLFDKIEKLYPVKVTRENDEYIIE
jgi:ferric-dicitrate binding protein FerR (iron transport regulator)